MKKLEKYYEELNSFMEEKAEEKEMIFTPPPHIRSDRKRFVMMTAAAVLAIVPVLSISIWRKISYENLIKEENSLFLSALLEGTDQFGYEEASSGYFSDTDWFDMEGGNL